MQRARIFAAIVPSPIVINVFVFAAIGVFAAAALNASIAAAIIFQRAAIDQFR